MHRVITILALLVCLSPGWSQSLRGTVTDPSGAAVPGAVVQLRGPGGDRRAKAGDSGQYGFPALRPGKYQVRVTAQDFSPLERTELSIDGARVVDFQLSIQAGHQVIRVDDGLRRVRSEPDSNGSAMIMGERQIGALSDDPDELALQLQALAGPAPGPDGGQFYVDGFLGNNLPPKSSIREVRINSNPFSPEYDQPGFARIDIFTKPGSDEVHGQAFTQYSDDLFNARNPLLTTLARVPYRAQLSGFSLGGPLKKSRASFTLDVEHREIHENGFVLATTLDAALDPVRVNQALGTPQSRTSISQRIDYAITPRNTLVARFQDLRIGLDNLGVGDFNLPSRAYNQRQSEQLLQVTETAMIHPKAINETRIQYLRAATRDNSGEASPAILVLGAFSGGGPSTGNSGSLNAGWELTNVTIYTRGRHTVEWGGRVRRAVLTDTSVDNFAGSFSFYSLEQYRATLAGQPGAGPAQFSLNAGSPTTRVPQSDFGLFAGDDWRIHPRLTVSLGVRYEAQTNLGGRADWAPRIGIAWALTPKTILRAGAGVFYDRLPMSLTLNRLRYDGVTQQSYLILDPTFFPAIPTRSALEAARQPQQLRQLAADIRTPQLYQTSLGIDRQLNQVSHITLTWIGARGVHLLDSRNINTPLGQRYPYGDPSVRLLTESAGQSLRSQLVANANVTWRKIFLFGYYALSYGRDDVGGLPANPYDLRAEWGPSAFADLRHRMATGIAIPAPGKLSINPFVVANSGVPYNITTGFDPGLTGSPSERPAHVPGCEGMGATCFTPGSPAIERNYARGPANWNIALRVSRTWSLGEARGRAPLPESGGSHGGAMGGPPSMPATGGGGRYNLTLSASTLNALNHANFAPPNGVLSSDYFGQYRSLGGLIVMQHGGAPTTYNRKIDVSLRLTF